MNRLASSQRVPENAKPNYALEAESYERLKRRTLALQKNIPGYVKEIIEQHLKTTAGR
jgi:predicted DNA-binding protein